MFLKLNLIIKEKKRKNLPKPLLTNYYSCAKFFDFSKIFAEILCPFYFAKTDSKFNWPLTYFKGTIRWNEVYSIPHI